MRVRSIDLSRDEFSRRPLVDAPVALLELRAPPAPEVEAPSARVKRRGSVCVNTQTERCGTRLGRTAHTIPARLLLPSPRAPLATAGTCRRTISRSGCSS